MGFIYVVFLLVFSVLNIILFFKIWGMTNDVARLTHHFCDKEPAPSPVHIPKAEGPIGEYDHRLDNVRPGDKVRRQADGKLLEVVSVGTTAITAKGGMLDGIHDYPKDVLTFE